MSLDSQALDEICRRLGPSIYRRCLKILGHRAEAEDVLQEVFIRLLRHRDKIPPVSDQLRWSYTIATRICLNRLRDRSRRPQQDGFDDLMPAPSLGNEWLAHRDLAARIFAAVPEEERTVAWLTLVDGHSQEEAGDLLGLSRKTVGKKLAHFLALARRMLAKEGL